MPRQKTETQTMEHSRRGMDPEPPQASNRHERVSSTPRHRKGDGASVAPTPQHLVGKITWRRNDCLRPFPGNARQHPEAQIKALMKVISRFWTIPILIDETGTILCGHARHEAAKRLGMAEIPTITILGLSDAEKRSIVIADNRLPEKAVWDSKLLREHFNELIRLDFDLELTGFSTGEVDLMIDGATTLANEDAADDVMPLAGPAISQLNDEWELGHHRLLCGDALVSRCYHRLLHDQVAQMVVTDPPYNVRIESVVGRGKTRQREFVKASGELSEAEYTEFLAKFIGHAISFSRDGAIHFLFTDWRHLPELLSAARPQYSEWKNLLVWNKTNAGQGSFYRSKHELIATFKSGTAAHINNFGLGAEGRYRTNVIDCPSVNSLHPARRGDLQLHPTVKPVALIADLIRDCSRRNGIILDPFGGSGTTIIAAERTGRRARVMELDPLYVDVAIRRWESLTNVKALHTASGRTFAQVEAHRACSATADTPVAHHKRKDCHE
jgi:DNA modification methylase